MAKSARASRVKKNNQVLKKRVFAPVSTARNERLSAKLLELASQPKPPRTEMEGIDEEPKDQTDSATKADSTEDTAMNADDDASKPTATALRRRKTADKARIEKKRHRRERNRLVFKTRSGKSGTSNGKDRVGKTGSVKRR